MFSGLPPRGNSDEIAGHLTRLVTPTDTIFVVKVGAELGHGGRAF